MFEFGRSDVSQRLIVIKMLDGNNDNRHRTRREGRLYRTRHKGK